MKSLKVSAKLTTGFAIILIFTIVVGAMAIIALHQLKEADVRMYERSVIGIQKTNAIIDCINLERQLNRELVLALVPEYNATVPDAIREINESRATLSTLIEEFDAWAEAPEIIASFQQFKTYYTKEYLPAQDKVIAAANADVFLDALNTLEGTSTTKLREEVGKMVDYYDNDAKVTAAANAALAGRFTAIQIALIAVAVIVSIIMTLYISRLITRPVKLIQEIIEDTALTGNMDFSDETKNEVRSYGAYKDEISVMLVGFAQMMDRLIMISGELERMAKGDLTSDFKPIGARDKLGNSLTSMMNNLNDMFLEIRQAASQVSAGAGQIATGAQTLASGTSQQAATIQQFSATMTELQAQIAQTATNSAEANAVSSQAGQMMEETIGAMQAMTEAMTEIDDSSQSITKVIKVIDDIAFQTNILALNAAVEAARAGQHGRGFAVVADEVRNLASKSAEAAKETSSLIEGSSQKVAEGNVIVEKSNASMLMVGEAAQKSVMLMEGVSTNAQHQSKAVQEVTTGISQISDVIQANSATAEESAAAAEELSAQAAMLDKILSNFKLRGDRSARGASGSISMSASTSIPSSAATSTSMPVIHSAPPEIDLGDGLDKY